MFKHLHQPTDKPERRSEAVDDPDLDLGIILMSWISMKK